MLFDYAAPALQLGLQSNRAATIWSRFPLQPLAPGALTSFSYSVLAELAGRAWYLHYDRLGFDPMPRAKIVRRHKGHAYFNLSLCAQMEADHAGVEPLSLHVNGARQPLATWEKPGFLAGFKLSRSQKRIDDALGEYTQQIGPVTEKARAWYLKTQAIQRWGQAEVLQIMEEIERAGAEAMAAFLAARYQLGQHYARLLADTAGSASASHASLLINDALCDRGGLVEAAMVAALPELAETLRDPAALAWLKAGAYAKWRSELPSPEAIEQVKRFMAEYGHRTVHEGELANPRWSEDAGLLMRAALAQIEQPIAHPSATSKDTVKGAASGNLQPLLALLPTSARKQGEQAIHKMAELHKLQSRALHALMYIWGGTRTWALAAAREAMVDKRLQSQDEVFLFELEEIKQLMTGEWNISSLDEIRALVATRQAEQAAIQAEIAPDILVGDDEAFAAHEGLPGNVGIVTAPLRHSDATQEHRGAIVASEVLDSGYVLALPQAAAFVAATGTPCDPFVVAAHAWQQPVAVGLGKRFTELQRTEGVTTTLDVSRDGVTVTQG